MCVRVSGTSDGRPCVARLSSLSASTGTEDLYPDILEMIESVFGDVGADEEGQFALPPLGYAPDGLGEAYPEELLASHYDIHNKIVSMLNHMVEQARDERWCVEGRIPRAMTRTLSLWAWEHAMHCLFWRMLSPSALPRVPDNLGEAMEQQYGSVVAAVTLFASLCASIDSRGWGIMGYQPDGKLIIFHTGELINAQAWPVKPLLVCDMWEHAYQPVYGKNRSRWMDNFLEVVDWSHVAGRYRPTKPAE